MARLIRIEHDRPFRISPEDFPKDGKSIWICGCGLTRTWPYCDKSHGACDTEEAGKTYVYGGDGSRKEAPGQ